MLSAKLVTMVGATTDFVRKCIREIKSLAVNVNDYVFYS